MIGNHKVIVIIPLRGRSGRLPGKEMLPLNGIPMAIYVLNKWRECKYVDDIYVTTASDDYQQVVGEYGFKVINRPKELAGSGIKILPVIQHAVTCVDNDLRLFDYVIQGDVTNPLSQTEQFECAIHSANYESVDSLFLCRQLDATLVNDPANDSRERVIRFRWWGSFRLRTLATLLAANPDTWGIGTKHRNLDIVQPWEIDIHHEWDYIQAKALVEAGY